MLHKLIRRILDETNYTTGLEIWRFLLAEGCPLPREELGDKPWEVIDDISRHILSEENVRFIAIANSELKINDPEL